jgi:hypothetical protein
VAVHDKRIMKASAGYPRLSMFVVWCVLCGVTGFIHCARAPMSR